MPELSSLIGTFLIGIAASIVGTTVGSGGLLTIPFLIFIGLPPQIAIATDRFGAIGVSVGAIYKFWKEKKIIWEYVPILAILALIGGAIGSSILLNVDEKLLGSVVGILILSLLPLIFLKPKLGLKRTDQNKKKVIIGFVVFLAIQIFGGFFGAGTGTMVFYTLMYFVGLTIIEASATNSIAWFVLAVSTSILFASKGIINYPIGIALFLGSTTGGYIGSHIAIKLGNLWIKRLFVIVVVVSAVKLLFF